MARRKRLSGSLGMSLLGVVLYRYRRALLAKAIGLRPVRYPVEATRNVRVPMGDGVSLATDLDLPQARRLMPTVLVRTPYGRGALGGPGRLSGGFLWTALRRARLQCGRSRRARPVCFAGDFRSLPP